MDNDAIVLEDAKDAAFALDKALRRAVRELDLAKVEELKPEVGKAFDTLSQARLRLLQEGMIATDSDVAEMRKIRAELEDAAQTQQVIQGAVKLVGLLRKFIV